MTVQGGHHVPVGSGTTCRLVRHHVPGAGRAYRHTMPVVIRLIRHVVPIGCSGFDRWQVFQSRMVILIGDRPSPVKASKDENIGPARAIGTATLIAGDQPQCFQVIQAVAQLALRA
ncbi:hypothetical protein, partial [Pseudovibrio sp. Ad26]|uniref:hypothetical protein n=1 Tax=Pseudovibrio sp. Ad26 TaxID=989410 RepID=UPI0012903142